MKGKQMQTEADFWREIELNAGEAIDRLINELGIEPCEKKTAPDGE